MQPKAKYRTLSTEELEIFEKEFIDFLVVNSITADDWEKIKLDQPATAVKIIDQFSNVVFESILRKTQYLEYRSPYEVLAFRCLPNKFIQIGITIPKDSKVTLDDPKVLENHPNDAVLETHHIKLTEEREVAMFKLLQNGCDLSDGKLFQELLSTYKA